MKIRINIKTIILELLLIAISICALLFKNDEIVLIVTAIQVIYIIWKSKFSYLSVLCFIINICLIPEYIQYSGGNTWGLLSMGYVPIYYYELAFCCYILNIIIIIIMSHTKALENEKKFFLYQFDISSNMVTILCIMALLLTYLLMPNLSMFSSRRFSGYISFEGWSCIPFFFIAVSVLSKKKKQLVYPITVIVCLWYIIHGERVDVTGMIVYWMLFYFNSQKRDIKSIIKYILLGSFLIIIMVIMGAVRDGTNLTINELMYRILVQPTVCDVTNVFNCAVDIVYKHNLFHGLTYFSYLINIIPKLNDPYSFELLIRSKGYFSAGGGLFFSEAIANYGFVFCVGVVIFYLLLWSKVIKKCTKYRALVYMTLCLASFRTAWYGLNYPMVTIIYFIPFVLILNNTLKKGSL